MIMRIQYVLVDDKRVNHQNQFMGNGPDGAILQETAADEGGELDYLDEATSMLLMKRIDQSVPGFSNEDMLLIYDLKYNCIYGVVQISDIYYDIYWSQNISHVVVADLKNHQMREFSNARIEELRYNESVIDLDIYGRRWEGGVRNDEPYGYGILFDEEGNKEYAGFMRDGIKCCYGVEYTSNANQINYIGCYRQGERFGKGTSYDRNGRIVYQGMWKNDEWHSSIFNYWILDNHVESITVADDRYPLMESFFPLYFLYAVKRIVIGNNSFRNVRVLNLYELNELESIRIGESSFQPIETYTRITTDSSFRIVNCPKVQSIQIGDYAFSDYVLFKLSNLPSLQFITIGKHCFKYVSSLSLASLIDGV